MPEVDEVLRRLRHLPDHLPSDLTPVERFADRARRRRRRRISTTLAACCALVAVALGVVVASEDGGSPVKVVGPAPDPSTESSIDDDIRAEPWTGLRDGQAVTVTGPFEATDVLGVGQCGAEARDAPDPVAWCEILPWTALPGEEGGLQVTVARSIETPNGVIDCTERTQRCLVGVRADSGDLLAPISFDPQLPPLAPPAVAVDRTAVEDGEAVQVSASGFADDAQVSITQCIGRPEDTALLGTSAARDRCDSARAALRIADSEGTLQTPFVVYSEVRIGDAWVRCEPCVLYVKAPRQPGVALSVGVRRSGAPVRPTVRIEPAPPYAPGQVVTLVGSGFQAGQGNVEIGICGFRTDHPESEVQGDPRYGHTPCGYPLVGRTVVADADGRLVVDDFRLPAEPFGFGLSIDCSAPDARCGLAAHPFEGSLPIFVTLFRLEEP